jgi:ATP-dependent DNA helicase RecG
MLRLHSDVQYVKGVGPRRASLLASRGIRTVENLLLHIPKSYQDRARFIPLASLRIGQDAAVHARVYRSRVIQTRTRGRILDVILTDGSSFAHAKWFHGGFLEARQFSAGREVVLFGRVDFDRSESRFVFFNPEFELIEDRNEVSGSLDIGRYVPIYEELAGITSRQFRRIVWAALSELAADIEDPLPPDIRNAHALPDIRTSLHHIHFPDAADDFAKLNQRQSPYHRRLIFEELFLLELIFALRRVQSRALRGVRFETSDRVRQQVKKILPFHPTAAQKRVLKEIVDDLKAEYPMNRLMQGDVGSGKTIVAFEAIVIAVENGYQAALMAPTEILAEQHYINAKRILGPLGYSIGVVRRGVRKAEKQETLRKIASGEIQVVIGTHALIEGSAQFKRIGFVIVDEQHRFGVVQRLQLMAKGENPNTLVMTATPIPRTLAMTLYGDLDLSVIDRMPPGRTPVKTVHFTDRDAGRALRMIVAELAEGRQAYVVYPVIEESEKVDLKSATEGWQKLSAAFKTRRVALLHGRLKSDEKESIMRAFAAGEIDILVSTTVIEVGVDVANATVMLIQHAERFGLAQLHQLRGRVGRGAHSSLCILMTPSRLNDVARRRIQAMVSTTDGFRLAEVDLQLRGPGEMAGTMQSGIPEFRVANLLLDSELLSLAQKEARRLASRTEEREKLIQAPGIRPTSDKLKETIFNILGAAVEGATFLDGCAGMGGIGIEAISRGASRVVFVEQSRKACRIIRENLDALGIKEGYRILEMDLARALDLFAREGARFHIAFVDPPYDREDLYQTCLERFTGDLLILEHSRRKGLPDLSGALRKFRSLVQGDAALAFYRSEIT